MRSYGYGFFGALAVALVAVACDDSEPPADGGPDAQVADAQVADAQVADAQVPDPGDCSGCAIDGFCFPAGTPHPTNPCETCAPLAPTASEEGWAALANGTSCSDGSFCTQGDSCQSGACVPGTADPCDDGVACNGAETCDDALDSCVPSVSTCPAGEFCDLEEDRCDISCAGCAIDGICYPDGAFNPANACESCQLAVAAGAWSPVADGSACSDRQFCTVGDACQAGVCVPGAGEPCGDGVDCNGTERCDDEVEACFPGTATCGVGTFCDTASDACVVTCDGCFVDGACYPDGAANPANTCESCQLAVAADAWSPVSNGAACDDGAFCTFGDSCQEGVCTPGVRETCADGVSCNGTEICNEDTDSCAPGASACTAGNVCDTSLDEYVATCDGCLVDGSCYPDGVANPANPCQSCQVGVATDVWSVVTNGTACDDGAFCTVGDACMDGVCTAGENEPCGDGVSCNGVESCNDTTDSCVAGSSTCAAGQVCDTAADMCVGTCAGCTIAGVCYPEGAANPANACQSCQTGLATDAWSAVTDGAACEDGAFCTVGDSCQAGVCTAGTGEPCGDGVSCNGTESCEESTDSCSPGTSPCTAGNVCDMAGDVCVATCAGCLIDGSCYPDGVANPANPCVSCQAAAADGAWTAVVDGTACEDGAFCTVGDSCQAGVCTAGTGEPCGDGVSCNGVESCNDTTNSCVAGSSTCAAGQVCNTTLDSCVGTCAGCTIGGVCYPDGTADPMNACQSCQTGTALDAWSAISDGTPCSDGAFCTVGDACQAGVCAPGAAEPCGDGVSCNGVESCNEAMDRCVPGSSPCAAGTVCDPAADMCVGTCAGCIIGGVCYPDGILNPANPCESCQLGASAVGWTGVADGTVCGFNEVCEASACDCAPAYERVDGFCSVFVPVVANDDVWTGTVANGIASIIPTVNLLANDINNAGEQTDLRIVEVKSVVNGAATLDGTAIRFTGASEGAASFVVVVQNLADASTAAESTVTLTVGPAPAVIAVDDALSVQQGSTTVVAASTLIANDVGTGLTLVSVQDPVEGTVSLTGTTVSFDSTGIAGVPAQFTYTVRDGDGVESTGTVFVTVSPLNPVNAFVYTSSTAFETKRGEFQPPTIQSIFNTWARFDSNTYYPDGSTAAGAAASWALVTDEDINGDGIDDPLFRQSQNTSHNGFLSPDSFESYTHEATLWSTNSDNDTNGVAIAYDNSGIGGLTGLSSTLWVSRTKAGNDPRQGWGLMEGTTVLCDLTVGSADGGWSGQASRVRVVRQGDLVEVLATDWMTDSTAFFSPPPYEPSSLITIDLSSTTNNITCGTAGTTVSRDLTRYRGAKQYGYVNYSQSDSSFIDIAFDGGVETDVLVLLTNQSMSDPSLWLGSEVWRFDGSWSLSAGETIQDALGFVRTATNPDDGASYVIRAAEVERL